MPARDAYHEAVKQALIKDGWVITHDPLTIRYGGFDFFIDLGAESLIGASREGRKIAVEIKTFNSPSFLRDFHEAMGQFINYRVALAHHEPQRILFLAVSVPLFDFAFSTEFVKVATETNRVKVLVFDEQQEVIVRWIE